MRWKQKRTSETSGQSPLTTLKECIAPRFDLLAQAIVGNEVDIHESVLLGDGDIAPVGDEVHRFGHSKFYV